MMTWDRPQISIAGRHLITPTGICTASITVHDRTCTGTFVIFQQCSREVIVGLDFLDQHGESIDLKPKSIRLSEDEATPPECSPSHHALCVLEDQVSVPPSSSITSSGVAEPPGDVEGVVKGDQHLLDRETGVARGIARLRGGKAKVMLTNVSQVYKHLNKSPTIAYIDEIVDTSNAFVLSDSVTSTSTATARATAFDINLSLPMSKQQNFKSLRRRYKDCFSTSSRI